MAGLTTLEFAHKLLLAYSLYCKPLCQELRLPQTAFDILMFLDNNPQHRTARDIVELRGIPASLVSVHVERLVQEGYLTRQAVAGDRRKRLLACTEQAAPILQRGHAIQQAFAADLSQDLDEPVKSILLDALETIRARADHILERGGSL